MPTILSTKKLTSAQRERFFQKNIVIVDEDFISVELIDFQLDGLEEFVLFTSQNAVRSVLKHPIVSVLQTKKALCVGENTQKLLQKSGWEVVECTAYAHELAAIIEKKYCNHSFLFFCGDLRRDTLPNTFNRLKIVYQEVITYKTHKTPIKMDTNFDVILFFSPSAVESFLQKNTITPQQKVVCIGTTTAESVTHFSTNIITAKKQTIEGVLEEISFLF